MYNELDFLAQLQRLKDSFRSGDAVVVDKVAFKSILSQIKDTIQDIERITECG